jgi:hypothetical protein
MTHHDFPLNLPPHEDFAAMMADETVAPLQRLTNFAISTFAPEDGSQIEVPAIVLQQRILFLKEAMERAVERYENEFDINFEQMLRKA